MIEDRGAPSPPPVGPHLTLFLAGVIAVAMVGFVVGVGRPRATVAENSGGAKLHATDLNQAGARPTVTYSELRTHPIGPNRDFQTVPATFAMASRGVSSTLPVTPADKRRALAERAERRAFDGAPPTIPHAVETTSSAACLGCHEGGAIIGDRIARPIPHAPYVNCQQCHVAELDVFRPQTPFARSTFEGLAAPFEGARPWPGAPPVIPHSTRMRESCLGCHGPGGREGLRTSHPERKVCTQCHASTSKLDHGVAAGSSR